MGFCVASMLSFGFCAALLFTCTVSPFYFSIEVQCLEYFGQQAGILTGFRNELFRVEL